MLAAINWRAERMTNVWLVRAITGRVRVKWLDEEGDVCEWECDDEKAARAFGGSLLKFRPDMEISPDGGAVDERESRDRPQKRRWSEWAS